MGLRWSQLLKQETKHFLIKKNKDLRINEWVKSNHSNVKRVGNLAEYQRWGEIWTGINGIAKNWWIK